MIHSGTPPHLQGASTRFRATTPTAHFHSVKSPGAYHTPRVMSHQFASSHSNSSGRLNFRRSTSLGGTTMTVTRKGVGFSTRSGSGMSSARMSGGGRRTTTNLGGGYYMRKSSRR